MRQEEVARRIGLSRSAIVQIEAGNRSVSGLELDRFAWLYGREVGDFLTSGFPEENPLVALFRLHSNPGERDGALDAVRNALVLGRTITDIEQTLGVGAGAAATPAYRLPEPETKWQAVRQGEQVATHERHRLGLGVSPLPDIVEILEGEGIRTATENLPGGVSGITLIEPRVGTFIVVNGQEAPLKQRFSFAHEYAHALLDHESPGTLSRVSESDRLPEVRANAFAAALLMPERGVRQFVRKLAKGRGAANGPRSSTRSALFGRRGDRRPAARRSRSTMWLFSLITSASARSRPCTAWGISG